MKIGPLLVETFENRKPRFHVWFNRRGFQIRVLKFGLMVGW